MTTRRQDLHGHKSHVEVSGARTCFTSLGLGLYIFATLRVPLVILANYVLYEPPIAPLSTIMLRDPRIDWSRV